MKKNLRLFMMLLLTLVGSSTMWAGESEVYNFIFAKQSGPSGYDKTYTVTIGEKSWTIPGNLTNGDYLRIGGKSIDGVDRVIQCNDALSGTINKITFNHNGKSRANITVHSVTLTVASDADFNSVVETVVVNEPTVEKNTEGSIDFVPSSSAWKGDLYYKFTVKVSNSDTSNGGLDLTSLVFYQNVAGAVDPNVSFANESEEIEVGGTVTNELSKPNDLTVSYSSSSTSIATVDENGLVTGISEGKATITASWNAVTDKYNAGSVSYTVTVIPTAAAVNFVKVTNANQLVAGNEYILVGTKGSSTAAMGAKTGTNTYRDRVEVTVEDDKVGVKENSGIAILTLGGSSGEWTFLASDNSEYLAYTSTSNALHSATDPTLKTSQWIITNDFQLKNANSTDRYIQYNSGSTRFACYTGGQGASYLYVKEGSSVSDKLDPSLAFSSSEVSANLGEAFTAPTLSYAEGFDGTITYSSSNENVATVAQNGTVTILAAGSTTITASSEETSKYLAGVASYSLTVIDPNGPGSENKPYTVAEARAAIDAGTGTTGVYAKGIVSKIVTAYNEQYGNISYNISDDGQETSDQLQAYRGKSFNGENFTSADDIQVGDVVVIYGNLKKYNDIYEFDTNNYLISLDRTGNNNPIIKTNASLELAYDATSGEIAYTIVNPVSGKSLQATSNANWISKLTVTDNKVTFSTTTNSGTENRTATITLSYEGAESVTVTVTQKVYVIDYATLPFAFDGGRADIDGTAGLTQSGLGTDYNASPKLKFDTTGDELILKINERPGKLSFDIKGNSFSGSTFKLQVSADGNTYTDVESYTELAGTQSVIISDLDANVRYIKWIYTEKSAGNVALGNIKLAVYSNLIDPQLSFEKSEYTAILNESFTAPTLSNPYGVSVTYSSSNEKVATVEASTGKVTLVGAGETTITATSVANSTYDSGSASYKLTVTEPETPIEDNSDRFALVENVSSLKAGDQIVIVGVYTVEGDEENGIEASTTYYGLSTNQAKNNRVAVPVTHNADETISGNTVLQTITLENEDGSWMFNVGDGYLYAASSTSNWLRTEEVVDDNAKASISNDEGILFKGDKTHNHLRFNFNSGNPIFSCYLSTNTTTGVLAKIYRKATQKTLKGDANGDGEVNLTDALVIVDYTLGRELKDFIYSNCDLNNDGEVDLSDALIIVDKYVLHKED